MTTLATNIDMTAIWAKIAEDERIGRAAAPAVNAHNKAAILAALAAGGYSGAIVRFNGSGDSGAVEEIDLFRDGELATDTPDATPSIELQHIPQWGMASGSDMHDLKGALEELAYELIAQTHPGWENNDGGQGELEIDVAEARLTLNIGLNYIQTDDNSYDF